MPVLTNHELASVIAEAVAKLRENDSAEDAENLEAGRLAGAQWAGQSTNRTLRRLARAIAVSDGRNADTGTAETFVSVACNPYNAGVSVVLWETLDPKRDSSFSDFWNDALGKDEADRIEDRIFAIGFIEGALTAWQMKNA